VVANRKGVPATEGLKEAWSKRTSRCTRTGCEHTAPGELADDSEAHHIYRALTSNS
jgi:hypothetical protein